MVYIMGTYGFQFEGPYQRPMVWKNRFSNCRCFALFKSRVSLRQPCKIPQIMLGTLHTLRVQLFCKVGMTEYSCRTRGLNRATWCMIVFSSIIGRMDQVTCRGSLLTQLPAARHPDGRVVFYRYAWSCTLRRTSRCENSFLVAFSSGAGAFSNFH